MVTDAQLYSSNVAIVSGGIAGFLIYVSLNDLKNKDGKKAISKKWVIFTTINATILIIFIIYEIVKSIFSIFLKN